MIGRLVKINKDNKGTIHIKEIKGSLGIVVKTHLAPSLFQVFHVKLTDGRLCYCTLQDLEVLCRN